ncbi:hypothetical protein P879_11254 [Paragonimus westermani]|uniref:Uncharacterized protein n=1 Tax=Paragonimus westermani TaxID=34504 RepID=A0A8T0DD30_9TREM|nr:hypothetical protein P879_11254 [Paragonimus westermani]
MEHDISMHMIISYEIIKPTARRCRSTLVNPHGTISPPYHVSRFPTYLDCDVTILAPSGSGIRLTTHHIQVSIFS